MPGMDRSIDGVTVHGAEHGAGVPVVALHGSGVDHREVEAGLEAVLTRTGLHRMYPDLPGMGRTGADGLDSNDDVVTLLCSLIEGLDAGPALLIGHSYGAYLARGITDRRPDLVRGLALLCPVGEHTGELPAHEVVREDADVHRALDAWHREGYDDYFVIRTDATARRFRDHIAPAASLVDEAALTRIFSAWPITLTGAGTDLPVLIVAGRRDATAGFRDAASMVDVYPRATLAVVDDAGHALLHEKPDLVGALIADWIDRAITA